jgi:hypothetical protein
MDFAPLDARPGLDTSRLGRIGLRKAVRAGNFIRVVFQCSPQTFLT